MKDSDTTSSRRTVLKLLAGTAVGSAGFSSAATAEGIDWDESDVVRDDDGNSTWILRIDRDVDRDVKVTKQTAKSTATASQEVVADALSTLDGYSVENSFWMANAMLVSASKDSSTAAKELSALSGVRTVHPNFEFPGPDPERESYIETQGHGAAQYGLEQTNALDVWEQFGTKGGGTSVAVLDTGIDADHPDIEFDESNWAYFDEEGQQVDSDPVDNDGHGTHVSGTVAGGQASGLDGNPHLGVAPETELYNGKVLDDGGTFAQIIGGIEWAAEQDVDVINMSLGATGYFGAYIEPVQNAKRMGTLVVTSSGNSGPDTSGSPANVYDSFAVGATDRAMEVTDFSSGELVKTSDAFGEFFHLTGDWPLNYYVPNVSAPGNQVVSTIPGASYQPFSGTSMASPHTAGAAALLLSLDSDASPAEIEQALTETAVHGDGPAANPGPRYGEGAIDVLSAATTLTDGNVVTGTVTDGDGPVAGARVVSDFGTETTTAQDGSFSLSLADGQWTVQATDFGYAAGAVDVDVSGGETAEGADITLDDAVAVQPLSGQPDVIGTGESFTIAVEVANLESYGVSLTNSDVAAEDVTVEVAGGTIQPGESVSLSSPLTGTAQVTVTVSDDADTGALALSHEFGGPNGPVQVPTGPTEVMADPADPNLQIVGWDETQSVVLESVIEPFVTVENTGDRTANGSVTWWVSNPATDEETDITIPQPVTVPGGEQSEVSIPLRLVRSPNRVPGSQFTHGWQVGTDSVQTTATFDDAVYTIDTIDAPNQVEADGTIGIDVTLVNEGTVEVGQPINFFFDGVFQEQQSVAAAPGEQTTLSFEFDGDRVVRDRYQYTIASPYSSGGARVWVGGPQIPPRFVPYVNDNGVVVSSGLNAAIQDYVGDDLSGEDLNVVIQSYLTGEPLVNFL